MLAEHGGTGFARFKDVLAAALIEAIAPIASETRRLLDEPAHLDSLLARGAARATAIAEPIVREAERLVGLG